MTNKKLRSGMTLVEVVIAMSIFSLMTLAITMAFAACMKQNAKNIRRDYELNTQQTALEKGTEGGVQVYNDTFNNRQTLQFTRASDGMTVDEVLGYDATPYDNQVHYNAKNTAFNKEDINFELKTFSSSNLGSAATVSNVDEKEYVLRFNNLSVTDDIDIRIEMNTGTVAYTGNYTGDGYVNRTPMYSISLPAYKTDAGFDVTEIDPDSGEVTGTSSTVPSSMIIGLKMEEDYASPGTPYVTVRVLVNGGIGATFRIDATEFIYAGGELEYNYNSIDDIERVIH